MNVSLGVCIHVRHINHLEIRGPLVGLGSPSTTVWVLKFEARGLPVLGGGVSPRQDIAGPGSSLQAQNNSIAVSTAKSK